MARQDGDGNGAQRPASDPREGPGSLLDFYLERFLSHERQQQKRLISGGDVLVERRSSEAIGGGTGSANKEEEDIMIGADGHPLGRDAYMLPDGRRTCGKPECVRRCQALCQRILPARELWRIGAKGICSSCLAPYLAWLTVKGVWTVLCALLVRIDRHT